MSQTLRIVQLNIGSLVEPDWENRRHEIVAWLNKLSPDVVCLQEVWESDEQQNTAGWLAERLLPSVDGDSWHWAFGGFPLNNFVPDPSLLFGSAVISRWKIDYSEVWKLPVHEGVQGIASKIPWELLYAETAGLDLFSTHLAAAPTDGLHRIEQVKAIDRHIKKVRGTRDEMAFGGRRKGMPPILCGDFNAEPDSDEIRFLSSLSALDGETTFYQDAWRVAGGDGPGYTQDWRDNPTAADLNIHRKRIDYVFVGDGFRRESSAGRIVNTEVAFDTAMTGVVASDHRGIVSDIVWPGRPTH